MTDLLLYGLIGLGFANLTALLLLWRRAPNQQSDPVLQQQLLELKFAQETLRGDLAQLRNDLTGALSQQRTELHAQLGDMQRSQSEELSKGRTETSASVQASTAATNRSLELVHTAVDERLTATLQQQADRQAQVLQAFRGEVEARLESTSTHLRAGISDMQRTLLDELSKGRTETASAVTQLAASTKQGIDAIGGTVEARLELMRATVDEKLSVTLDTRLAATFKQVGDRLEAVQTGLVEMRSLAGDVSDLRRVMVNVKARGTWGEVQLGNILEQIFAQDQYEKDFKPRQRGAEVVEYAIRLPGPDAEPVYLPIDSKFPIEDYLRLVEAAEAADKAGVESARTALGNRIWGCAKDIHHKYIAVPRTTNFAVLFLPTEALYAEVVRLPGVVEEIQNKYRVTVQGPSTFAAFANALLMGFRTVALQKRSAEVGKLLGAVRTDFGKFADLLGKVEERLDQAKERLGDARKRSTQIVKKLGKVEALPEGETAELLPDPAFDIDAIEEID